MASFDYPINAYLSNANEDPVYDMVVDGSSTPVAFSYTADGIRLSVHRMIGLIQDASAFSAENYGGLAAPLSNGIEFEYVRPGQRIDLLGGRPIFTNAGWGAVCYDIQSVTFGQGNSYLLVRWTFTISGTEIVLDDGESLEMTINDNLTGLVHHRWMIQGHVERVIP